MTVKFETYFPEISRNMTEERAKRIRQLRVDYRLNLVDVSVDLHKEWGKDATWPKAGDKAAGEALCVAAARVLGETPYKDPWA